MRPLLVSFLLIVLLTSLSGQTPNNANQTPGLAGVEKIQFKACPLDLKNVRLLPGMMKDLLDRNKNYLLSLSADRLVHNFRVNAGLPSHAVPLGGWESPGSELRGHFTGHYLSACALMYSATGDERLKKKGTEVVDALAQCQQALGASGYLSAFPEEFFDRVESGKWVWAPYYTLHKIMAGLLDMYVQCGDRQALNVLTRMAGWVKTRTDKLDKEQVQEMLKIEFGGMAEVLANLSGVTGNPAYLSLASRFEKRSFLDPLMEDRDVLKGLHVNTHIPQVIAAAREYELTGTQSYNDIATYFWNEVVDARTYATGGTSNYEYWREDPYHLSNQLSQESHENCCTYNMLKLTDHLFSWSPDGRLMDYYERALFSAILPTQHPQVGGAIMYYVPLKSGLFKMFGIPDSSYFCCNGSGIESFSKLGSSIYYQSDRGIYVNLFVASEAQWIDKGVTVRQETQFPEQEGTKLVLKLKSPSEFSLFIRIPSWTQNKSVVKLNGRIMSDAPVQYGYLEIHRRWKSGDKMELELPMSLTVSRFPDDSTVGAILYGPIVLAGALGHEAMTKEMQSGLGFPDVDRMVSKGAAIPVPSLVEASPDVKNWIRPVKGKPLTFRTSGAGRPGDVTLIPFYKMFGQRYALYWNIYTPSQWQSLLESRPKLPNGELDRVLVADRQSDRDHNFQAWRFENGERKGRKWVKSPLWFRYDLDVDEHKLNTLKCTYWAGEKDSEFDILIDGEMMAAERIAASKEGAFVEKPYSIAGDLISGKRRVAVMFRGKEKKPTAELYECAIVESGK